MNIYKFEAKTQVKNMIIWTVAMIALLVIFQNNIYRMFENSLGDMQKAMSGVPKTFLMAFGFDINKMSSFSGFFNLTYSYLALMGAIMAIVISLTVFAREKRNKCVDFLFSKPLVRGKIFFAKLGAVVTIIIITNIGILITAAILYKKAGEPSQEIGRFLLSVLGLFFNQIVFVAIGIAIAVHGKRIRSVSGIATAVGFGSFILSAMYGILEKEVIRFIAPLKYFDATAVTNTGHYEVKYISMAIAVILVCVITTYLVYCKRDTRAV